MNVELLELDRGRKKPAASEVQKDMDERDKSDACIRFPLCAMDADDEGPCYQLQDCGAFRRPARIAD